MIENIEFTSGARADVRAGARYYEEKLEGLGLRFASAVQLEATNILTAPNRYPIATGGIRQSKIRKFPYTIYFRLLEDRVVVICVHAVRRDPVELLNILSKR